MCAARRNRRQELGRIRDRRKTLDLSLICSRTAELSESVKARAQETTGVLMKAGINKETLSRFAETIAGRAELCALMVRV